MEQTSNTKHTIQNIRPKPILTVSFYMEYQKKILNEFKYDNGINEIYAFYDINSPNPFLRFEDYSFDLSKFFQKTGKLFYMKGILAHYSTIESFNKLSNYEELVKLSQKDNANNQVPTFILLIFGDLKNYTFTYSLIEINNDVEYKLKKLYSVEKLEEKEISELIKIYASINSDKSVLNYYTSKVYESESKDHQYLFVHDISVAPTKIPSFMKIAIKENINNIKENAPLSLVLVKEISDTLQKSVIISIDSIVITQTSSLFDRQNIKTQTSDLKQMFDPISIAENAVDLNINLMKWRMAPDLDVRVIKEKKFLLVGAGTLGCHVSRNLLGWGAKHINFLDCGKISYSNPVRQSLYTFKDSSEGNNFKSVIAAQKLKEIFPLVNSEGYILHIPLPSRTLVNENAEKSYLSSVEQLEKIISEHDVIFLLTDSRESRWFPTMIAKALNKIVITSAIGFDSFVVMQHGIKENKLGCYFCNDIVSPIDTSDNRTLDQQCTISRPGISSICSGFACELAISILQKDTGFNSHVPHSIRGNLTDYNFLSIDHSAFKNCVACSEFVQREYLEDRQNFLIRVMNDPYYIENISGVEKLIKEINLEDIEVGDDF